MFTVLSCASDANKRNFINNSKRTANTEEGSPPESSVRPENKFAIVPPRHQPGIVRLPATEGQNASSRRCGSRSTRAVHNIMSSVCKAIINKKAKYLATHRCNAEVVNSENIFQQFDLKS